MKSSQLANIQREKNTKLHVIRKEKRRNTKDDYYSIEELVDEEDIKTTPNFQRLPSRKLTTGPILERLSLFTKQLLNISSEIQSESNTDNTENILTFKKTSNRRLSMLTDSEKEFSMNSLNPLTERNKDKFKDLKMTTTLDLKTKLSANLNINFNEILPKEKVIVYGGKTGKSSLKTIDSDSQISAHRNLFPSKEIFIHPKVVHQEVESPRSPSKWTKISHLFKSIKGLNVHETKNLKDEDEIDEDIQDYQERHFDNTVKARKSESDSDSSRKLFGSNFLKLYQLNESGNSNESINLKEDIKRIIIEGDSSSISKIDRIFKKDPQYYLRDENNPKSIFDTPLSNGKTLLYLACKEGKTEIVKYMVEKGVDALIKSKLGERETETPLQVASRWNYVNIINILLEKVSYKREHIEEALEMEGITSNVKNILKKYIFLKFKKTKRCYC